MMAKHAKERFASATKCLPNLMLSSLIRFIPHSSENHLCLVQSRLSHVLLNDRLESGGAVRHPRTFIHAPGKPTGIFVYFTLSKNDLFLTSYRWLFEKDLDGKAELFNLYSLVFLKPPSESKLFEF